MPPPVQAQTAVRPVELPRGQLIGRRWKITEKLGQGGCGAVYLVENQNTGAHAALKAEANVTGGCVLLQEVAVLTQLAGRPHVPQFVAAAQMDHYSYAVMSLLGHSLSSLFHMCGREFSVSTQLRVGLQVLYGLKQLHEVGFVHHDVKPANLAIGRAGSEGARVVHLLDFGIAREFVIYEANGPRHRLPRPKIAFRGTRRYASVNAHKGREQGRVDDLWSMMYVLAEMRTPLPWGYSREHNALAACKAATSDARLFHRSPLELREMGAHLRTLDYAKRPKYALLYCLLTGAMVEHGVKYSDPFDWELRGVSTTADTTKASVVTVSEAKSGSSKKTGKCTKNRLRTAGDAPADAHWPPFTTDDLAKNELGF